MVFIICEGMEGDAGFSSLNGTNLSFDHFNGISNNQHADQMIQTLKVCTKNGKFPLL